MGAVEHKSAAELSQLVNTTGIDLILSDLLNNKSGGFEHFYLDLFQLVSVVLNKSPHLCYLLCLWLMLI